MPIACHFRPAEELALCVHDGVVDDEEFLASYRGFFQDPRFDGVSRLLIDLRRTDSSPRTRSALQRFSEKLGRRFGRGPGRARVAVVAPSDVSFGLARMLEMSAEHPNLDVGSFRQVADAVAWLGVTEQVLEST